MTIRSCQDQQTHTNNHTHTHTVHAQAAIKCTELIQQRHRTDMHRYFHSARCEKCHSFRSDACPTKCLQVPVSSASRCMFVRSQTKYLNWFCLQHWQKHERRPNYYTDTLGTFRHRVKWEDATCPRSEDVDVLDLERAPVAVRPHPVRQRRSNVNILLHKEITDWFASRLMLRRKAG